MHYPDKPVYEWMLCEKAKQLPWRASIEGYINPKDLMPYMLNNGKVPIIISPYYDVPWIYNIKVNLPRYQYHIDNQDKHSPTHNAVRQNVQDTKETLLSVNDFVVW